MPHTLLRLLTALEYHTAQVIDFPVGRSDLSGFFQLTLGGFQLPLLDIQLGGLNVQVGISGRQAQGFFQRRLAFVEAAAVELIPGLDVKRFRQGPVALRARRVACQRRLRGLTSHGGKP